MICSSWPVPSVATTSACVSPRVNSDEPWARGRMPTSARIGRHRLGVAAVDALAGVEDGATHHLGLEVAEGVAELRRFFLVVGEQLLGLFLDRADLLLAGLLLRLGEGLDQLAAHEPP
jgi:hypothetical protein